MEEIVKIASKKDYDKAIKLLEEVAAKGEEHLTEKELKWVKNTAEMIAAYEERKGMTPVNAQSVDENETDVHKIAAALGYEPQLTDIIRFKMLQKKLNQKKLAALLNMTESKVSQILSGKREPDLDFLRGIHAKLGIDGNILLKAA